MGIKEDIVRHLKGTFANLAFQIVDNKVDGGDITRNLDKQLDEQLGKKQSEKLQSGVITNLLLEMLCGLYDEDPMLLVDTLREYAGDLEDKIIEGGV